MIDSLFVKVTLERKKKGKTVVKAPDRLINIHLLYTC